MPIVGSGKRLFRVTPFGTILSEPMRNEFYYNCDIGSTPTAEAIATIVKADIVDPVATLQNDQTVWNGIEVIDLMNDENFFVLSFTVTGSSSSGTVADASYQAFEWRLHRSSRDMRGGFKRWAGLWDADSVNNTLTSAFQTANDAVIADIELALTVSGSVLQMCVVRDGPTKYDTTIDPQDPTTWRYTNVASIEGYPRITTQNSRKKSPSGG